MFALSVGAAALASASRGIVTAPDGRSDMAARGETAGLARAIGAAAAPDRPSRRPRCQDGRCACGDLIEGTVRLERGLRDCGRVGLVLASGAKLDCAGHALRGRGPYESGVGVLLDRAVGATVRGCRIEGFRRAVRLRGGRDNRVLDNELSGNVYGVEVAGATRAGTTSHHEIAGNTIRDSIMDGIHLGTGTSDTIARDNRVEASGQEGIYLLWCQRCVVARNDVRSDAGPGIYIKHSSDGQILDNRVEAGFVQVRGDSARNVFAGNVLIGASFVFEGYRGRGPGRDAGWTVVPRDNEVVGGAVLGRKICLRFNGATGTRVKDVQLRDCRPSAARRFGAYRAEGNTVAAELIRGGDHDADGVPDARDACTDADGDGASDPAVPESSCPLDTCPMIFDATLSDSDGDGVGDACDLCPLDPDPAQRDRDGDGLGDACDPCLDVDGDGRGEGAGGCPLDACPDGMGTLADEPDSDGDGRGDACDPCPHDGRDRWAGDEICASARTSSGGDSPPRATAADGLGFFTRPATEQEGLGPLFNAETCVACHDQPVVGGSGRRGLSLVGTLRGGTFDPLHAAGGPVLQHQGIQTTDCAAVPEQVPAGAMLRLRASPPLFGLGRVDALPAAAILAHEDPEDADGDGVSGRAARVGGGVGRFGWKARAATLEEFVGIALAEEVGVTSPAHPEEAALSPQAPECDPAADPEDDGTRLGALVAYVAALPPPGAAMGTGSPAAASGVTVRPRAGSAGGDLPRLTPSSHGLAGVTTTNCGPSADDACAGGELIFARLGCATCHVPVLGDSGAGEAVALYSDLLLHDMGEGLADGIVEGDASGAEFRTAPLWGLASRPSWVHDGRAASIDAAIAAHGGESAAARDRWLELPAPEREQLATWLRGR